MLTRIRSSAKGRIDVASPSSVCSRQTNPGARSAIALTGSSSATKSARAGESIGSRGIAMLAWAMCQSWVMSALGQGGDEVDELLAIAERGAVTEANQLRLQRTEFLGRFPVARRIGRQRVLRQPQPRYPRVLIHVG